MSIIIPVTGSTSVNPSSLDSTNSVYESATNIDRGYADVSSTNYAQFYLTTGIGSETWIYYVFSSPNIPSGAIITSISCQVKASISNISALGTKEMQMYTGTTAKGTAVQFTSTNVDTFTLDQSVSNWTISQLNNARIVIKASRSNVQPSTSYYVRFYGATLTINYTVNETGYEVKVESSLPNTKGVYATPEYQAIFASDTSTLQDITITNKDGLNLTLSDNGTKIASFTNTSYTYSIASLTTDHAIKIDATATNFSKINNQWRSIAGVYQKNSGVWTATTFNSAFPSGTMIKQGDDLLDSKPLVKFLENCDVVYINGFSDDEYLSSVSHSYTITADTDNIVYYILTIFNASLGLHKLTLHIANKASASTSLIEYGSNANKIYIDNSSNTRCTVSLSSNGTSSQNVHNGTLITLKLKTNTIESAVNFESMLTTNSGIIGSSGRNGTSFNYLTAVNDYWPCYCLVGEYTSFGLAKISTDKVITTILGAYYSPTMNVTNRSMMCNYSSSISYSGYNSTTRQQTCGGSFFYL